MDYPSFNDLFRIGRDEAASRNLKLLIDAIDREGSDSNILLACAAAIGDEVIGQLAKATADSFLDSAKGTALDRLVYDRYGLTRKAAAPAYIYVQLHLSTPAAAPFVVPAGTTFSTADGKTFSSVVDTTFLAGSSELYVLTRSTASGADQQIAGGTITSVTSSIPGAPDGLSVSNIGASSGAADTETDDSLRARARLFFSTVRLGTKDAIVAGALAYPGVVAASAFESVDGTGQPAGTVQVVISDAFTDALVSQDEDPPTYQTQSQALAAAVSSSLDSYRAAGVQVDVLVAQVVLQPVHIALSFPAGSDTEVAATQAVAEVVQYTNSLAPGATWVRADAQAAIRNVNGIIYTGYEVVVPSGDVVPVDLQAIRTTASLVKVI